MKFLGEQQRLQAPGHYFLLWNASRIDFQQVINMLGFN